MPTHNTIHILLALLFLCNFTAQASSDSDSSTCKRIECPPHETIHKDSANSFEIRRYNNTLWMSTSSPISDISLVQATRKGFLRLFAYIEGSNSQRKSIPMTAPVVTDIYPSDGPFCESNFVVSFYIPAEYQEDFPAPDPDLQLAPTKWGVQYVAVRSFSGFVSDSNVGEEAASLQKSLAGTPWEAAIPGNAWSSSAENGYSVAQYNSPFEFENRLNEIWFLFNINNNSAASFVV